MTNHISHEEPRENRRGRKEAELNPVQRRLLIPLTTGMKRHGLALAVLWTLIVAVSMTWNGVNQWRAMHEVAANGARTNFFKDVIYRRWNAERGGVYAEITAKNQPNPYLEVKEREIETPSGRRLTLVNPAYMTRQVHELELEEEGVRGHITSLNPIRPANAPDAWERRALESFEQGETEAVSVETLDSTAYLRLMRPLVTEKGCLKCHAKQGYKEGDIRGGICVSVPMGSYTAVAWRQIAVLGAGHGAVWLLGLLGLGFFVRRINAQQEGLREREERFRSLVEGTSNCVKLFDKEGRYAAINYSGLEAMGWTEEDVLGRRFPDVWPEETQPIVEEMLARALQGEKSSFEADCIRPDGTPVTWWVVLNPIRNDDGSITQLVGISTDITDRKQAEQELERTFAETERMNRLMSGREDRVLELKDEVNALLAELGREPQYSSVATPAGSPEENETKRKS